MSRLVLAVIMAILLTASFSYAGAADGSCGDDVPVFPGLGGDADIFGLSSRPEPEPEPVPLADALPEEDCGDAIPMDVEPRPGMLVALLAPPKAEQLVCAVTSEVIETYRAHHGNVDYLLAPDPARPVHEAAEGGGASLLVAHVITTDPDYVSPEGLRVGDTVERALALAGGEAAFTIGGLCLSLPSGWTACFDPRDAGVTPGGVFAPSPDAPIMDFHLM